jgi:hypothetical protein
MIGRARIDVLLTLLQFIALSLPAIAILLQVVLQFQSQYVDDENAASAIEFRLIEFSLLILVVGGVLLALPIVLSLSSIIAQIGLTLSLLSLGLLVLAIGISLRRSRYPTEEAATIEEAIVNAVDDITRAVIGTIERIESPSNNLLYIVNSLVAFLFGILVTFYLPYPLTIAFGLALFILSTLAIVNRII